MKIDVFENLNIYISKQLQSLDNLKIKTINLRKYLLKSEKNIMLKYIIKEMGRW
jgi:hypothetical protein